MTDSETDTGKTEAELRISRAGGARAGAPPVRFECIERVFRAFDSMF